MFAAAAKPNEVESNHNKRLAMMADAGEFNPNNLYEKLGDSEYDNL